MMDTSTFLNPPAPFRILPSWSWNSTIEEGEIVRQIREMSDKGLGGFCLSAGPGLRIPYLSKVWFDRVRLAVETARECGLQVWLQGEYPHPHSISGGQVSLGYPQYRAQHLTFDEITVQGGQQVDMELPWGTVLRALAVPLKRDRCLWESVADIGDFIGANQRHEIYDENTGDAAYYNKRFLARHLTHRLFWKAPPGRWRVLVFLQRESDAAESHGIHFDPFNAEAVACFLETTHGRYAKGLANRFGGVIQGIITTEASSIPGRWPWSPTLPRVFRERNQYDLLNCLPALMTYFGPNTARIRYDYFQTLSEMLRDNFHKVLGTWCAKHKVLHAADVTVFRNAHRSNVHIPGTSGGGEKVGGFRDGDAHAAAYRRNPRFSVSVHDGGRTFNTCFQDTGWSLTLQDMKWTIDRMGALGANLFHARGLSYTIDGLRKHHNPPSIFHQNPYWKHFRLLADYAGRLSYVLSQGRRRANLALLDPATSLWAHLGSPSLGWKYIGYDEDEAKLTQRLALDWAYLIESLCQMQRDFDSLDPETLATARIAGDRLQIGAARYDVLILPPITNLERDAFERIREFINAGGKVICLGLLPIEDIQEGPSVVEAFSRLTDMEPGRMRRDYIGHELGVHLIQRGDLYFIRTGGSVEKNRGARMLGDLLHRILPPDVIVETDKKNGSAILSQRRETPKEDLFFFTNTDRNAFTSRITITVPSKRRKVERWDLETGRRTSLMAEREGDRVTLDLNFERLQSHLIVASEDKPQPLTESETPAILRPDSNDPWKVDPEEDNCLRMDKFQMQLDPQKKGIEQGWHKPGYRDNRWTSVTPKPMVEQIRDLPSLSSLPFTFNSGGPGQPAGPGIEFPLVCWFRTAFSADVVPSKLSLVMDRSAILGDYQIYLNGVRLPGKAFRPTFRYDHNNVTCAVVRRVTTGRNVLAIRVELDHLDQGLVDAFYLFGKFGVRRWLNHNLRIIAPVDRGFPGELDNQKMPYYAGTVVYTKDMTFSETPESEQFVFSLEEELKDVSDIVEVAINGRSLGTRAWAPYKWTARTEWLKPGKNRIVVRMTNTLSRLLTGSEFETRSHSLKPVTL